LGTVSAARTDWESMIAAEGVGLAAVGLADLLAEGVVDPAQGAVGGPAGEVAVDGGPGWEVGGQRAPDAAVVDQVADGVDDLAAGVGLGSAAGGLGAGWWGSRGSIRAHSASVVSEG
jgi:hypothetical protein